MPTLIRHYTVKVATNKEFPGLSDVRDIVRIHSRWAKTKTELASTGWQHSKCFGSQSLCQRRTIFFVQCKPILNRNVIGNVIGPFEWAGNSVQFWLRQKCFWNQPYTVIQWDPLANIVLGILYVLFTVKSLRTQKPYDIDELHENVKTFCP